MAAHLANRENWQQGAQGGGNLAEEHVSSAIQKYLTTTYPGEWLVERHPKDLAQLYLEYDYEQSPESYKEPQRPVEGDLWRDPDTSRFLVMSSTNTIREAARGCIPDFKLQHIASGKSVFLECKNQNDAGNAHERACKYVSPSLVSFVQKKLGVNYHPFGYVFTGGMVEHRKYILELQILFGFAKEHLFLWKAGRPKEPLIEWLETVILPPLRP